MQSVTCVYSHTNPHLYLTYGKQTQCYNKPHVQGGSNMTGTDLCVNKPHCAAAVRP